MLTKQQQETVSRLQKCIVFIGNTLLYSPEAAARSWFRHYLDLLKVSGLIKGFKDFSLKVDPEGNAKIKFRVLYPWNRDKYKQISLEIRNEFPYDSGTCNAG